MQTTKLLANLEKEADTGGSTPQPLVSIGTGLSDIPKKLMMKMLASEYIDFAELPPVKGKGRPMPQSLEGQVIVVQAVDLSQSRKIIPDLATWAQCFSLYVAVVTKKFPERIAEFMSYQSITAKASQKYRWPS